MVFQDRFIRHAAAAQVVAGVAGDRLSGDLRAARAQHLAYYRALWSHAAADVGAPVVPLSGGWIEISLSGRALRVRGTHCSVDGPEVLARAGDKALVAALLTEAGLPVPTHRVVSLAALGSAHDFVATAPGPCVVKPARNTAAGRGVTTGVQTSRDLRRAAASAAAAGARGSGAIGRRGALQRGFRVLRDLGSVPLLVEHQVPGADYRLLYLDGELLDGVRREPPTVTADGRRTVAALLHGLNAGRLRAGGGHGQMLVGRDLDLEWTLAAQGLSLTSIPRAGVEIRLKTTINQNGPTANLPARDEICPELIAEGRRAAAVVGARLAGVDVLTMDPTVPLVASGGCVLEVNTAPGLAMHDHEHPGARQLAGEVLRRITAQPQWAQ